MFSLFVCEIAAVLRHLHGNHQATLPALRFEHLPAAWLRWHWAGQLPLPGVHAMIWLWVKNRVTPKWVALVNGNMDQNPQSNSWWFIFDPYPFGVISTCLVVKTVLGSHYWLVGEFTTHFRTYFSGDWDVKTGGTIWILTQGHFP